MGVLPCIRRRAVVGAVQPVVSSRSASFTPVLRADSVTAVRFVSGHPTVLRFA